ncbi:MAG: hypothetical protein JXA69_21500 [Phycisphaerae bacterium]|nr:hypothetical protein [Phycisphaerae bacterium]
MKHSIRTYVHWALLLASLTIMGQSGPCGPAPGDGGGNGGTQDGTGGTAPTTVGGSLDVVNLNVPSGQTTTVTSNVVINASGNVTIDGLLTAATATGTGASITIIAQGDIDIAGTVQAGDGAFATATTPAAAIARAGIAANGDGADGYHGGTVQLISHGNIRIPITSAIWAGDGTDGTSGIRGGAGGNGGHVVLCASGTLTVRGAIHVGSGGNGGDAAADTANSTPSQFTNRGGDSGFLYVQAANYDWPGLNTTEMSLDLMAYGLATGGFGGNAGFIAIADEYANCSGISITTASEGSATIAQEGGAIVGTVYKTRIAANGGHGWVAGGAGGSIQLIACTYTERDGESWSATAGSGGDVKQRQFEGIACVAWPVVYQGAFGGTGGMAEILVAPGMMGDSSTPNGGTGGSAEAIGGNGGAGEFFANHIGGPGGRAVASGGFGGSGWPRDCEDRGRGGDGGNGGKGDARGGDGGDGVTPGSGGEGIVMSNVASCGGDGGQGVPGGGEPGTGGELTETQGADGAGAPNTIVGSVGRTTKARDGEPGESIEPEWCQN